MCMKCSDKVQSQIRNKFEGLRYSLNDIEDYIKFCALYIPDECEECVEPLHNHQDGCPICYPGLMEVGRDTVLDIVNEEFISYLD